MIPPHLKTSDFDYDLPEGLIAQIPAVKRDGSRLLVVDRRTGELQHKKFSQITDYFRASDILVLNNTKVIPARLFGTKYGGGEDGKGAKIEVMLNRQLNAKVWEALVRPSKRLKMNAVVKFSDRLFAEVIAETEYGAKVLHFASIGDFKNELSHCGTTPLPPYIKDFKNKDAAKKLADRYQTVYAKVDGATAAPTAGLHFTQEMLTDIQAKGVQVEYVTLHTGLGTFQPVKTEYISDHKMHSEVFHIDTNVMVRIKQAKKEGRRIIAVGTTVVRLLENSADKDEATGETNLFITPGYKFKIVDTMITNFHLPKSTLIMLVCAFAQAALTDRSAYEGTSLIKHAYSEAIKQGYRFFSFGDAMLLL